MPSVNGGATRVAVLGELYLPTAMRIIGEASTSCLKAMMPCQSEITVRLLNWPDQGRLRAVFFVLYKTNPPRQQKLPGPFIVSAIYRISEKVSDAILGLKVGL